MSRKLKPTPERYCQFCWHKLERNRLPSGELESMIHFNRRKYCNRKCAGKAKKRIPSKAISWAGGHQKARGLVSSRTCVKCGCEKALDVHHVDGNHLNNVTSNLMRLCRSCHTKIHRTKKACTVCGKPVKGHGYCNKHYMRYKKYGNPMLSKVNQHRAIEHVTD